MRSKKGKRKATHCRFDDDTENAVNVDPQSSKKDGNDREPKDSTVGKCASESAGAGTVHESSDVDDSHKHGAKICSQMAVAALATKEMNEMNEEASKKFGEKRVKRQRTDNSEKCATVFEETSHQSTTADVHRVTNKAKCKREERRRGARLPKTAPMQYGNYRRYYDHRRVAGNDPRLGALSADWFRKKRCLDVGCNSGALTLEIGRAFHPKELIGLDLDNDLIQMAETDRQMFEPVELPQDSGESIQLPLSFALTMGRLPTVPEKKPAKNSQAFPFNVKFITGNVLDYEGLGVFDTVVCFSVTKWVHLNWGDKGILRLFAKLTALTKPGGLLLLETQARSSYRRRKNMTAAIYKNYCEMKIHSDDFVPLLVSETGGFDLVATRNIKDTEAHGFARPIHILQRRKVPRDQGDR